MVEEKTIIHKFAGKLSSMPLGSLVLGVLSIALLLLGTPSLVVLASTSPPNLDKALAAQQQMVTERPYDAEAHNDQGNLLVLAGRHEEAGDAYRRAIELAPGETLARYNLGILLQQTGHTKQALATFQGLLEIDARNARALYQMGMLFEERKQRAKAVEHYARAFAYDPDLTFARNNPHIIDNSLATEALLDSRRYAEAASSEMPRLYGEPERIVNLMLEEEVDEVAEAAVADSKDGGEREMGIQGSFAADGDGFEDEEDDEDEEASDGRSRRSLTREDLDTGSSVGRVQRQPARQPSRRSSAGRDGGRRQGRGGFPVVRPPSREGSGRGDQGRVDGRGGNRRYRPTSRFSTGRLELEFVLPGTAEQRRAATATL